MSLQEETIIIIIYIYSNNDHPGDDEVDMNSKVEGICHVSVRLNFVYHKRFRKSTYAI